MGIDENATFIILIIHHSAILIKSGIIATFIVIAILIIKIIATLIKSDIAIVIAVLIGQENY